MFIEQLIALKNAYGAKQVGLFVGVSERTVYRWVARETEPNHEEIAQISRLYAQFQRHSA